MHAIREVSGRSVPIVASIAAGAGAVIRIFGPVSMGGRGDIVARLDEEVTRTGLPMEEIGLKVDISVSSLWTD